MFKTNCISELLFIGILCDFWLYPKVTPTLISRAEKGEDVEHFADFPKQRLTKWQNLQRCKAGFHKNSFYFQLLVVVGINNGVKKHP